MSYVYLVQAENGAVKIGVANNVYIRLSSLQTGSPVVLKMLYCLECPSPHIAYKVEAILHNYYSEYHIHLEWYNVPVERVVKDIAFVQSLLPYADVIRMHELDDEPEPIEPQVNVSDTNYLPGSPMRRKKHNPFNDPPKSADEIRGQQ